MYSEIHMYIYKYKHKPSRGSVCAIFLLARLPATTRFDNRNDGGADDGLTRRTSLKRDEQLDALADDLSASPKTTWT